MILKYELKKMFSKKINRILLIAALLAAVALSVFAVGSARYVDENGEAHTGFMAARRLSADRNRWAGELTGDKIAQVVGSRQEINSKYSYQVPNEEYGKTIQSYSDIENFVIGVLTPDTDWDESVLYRLEDGQARELYSIYEGNLQEMAQEYGATPEQQHFLGSRSDAAFFSAKYGRTKATKNKVLAGMLAATVVYFAGMGIMLVLSLGVMGLSGFSTPYQIDQPYSIYAMTYGQYFLLTVLCGYIASLLAASVTMLIAARMRSASVAVCVPFLLFCVMPFIGRALSAFLTFFKLTPDMLVNVIECAKSPNVFQIEDLVFRQIPCIMLLYFIVSLLLLPFVYRGYYCYGLGKRLRSVSVRTAHRNGSFFMPLTRF